MGISEKVMRNPTTKEALPIYETLRSLHGLPYPKDATPEVTALAMIHKARLIWPKSSNTMISESKAWLIEHGMAPDVVSAHNGTLQ